jgi:hypothetical protein
MAGKIAAAVVAAIVLATAGAASAQTNTRVARVNVAASQAQAYDSYYNSDYWNAIASPARIPQRDPFVGTVFDNVVPY